MYNTGDLLKEWRTANAAADVEVRYLCECRNVREVLLVEEWRRLLGLRLRPGSRHDGERTRVLRRRANRFG
jgi:hypothetical protein